MSQLPPSPSYPPPGPGPVAYQGPNPQQNTGLAMGSMICGVLSIVLSFLSFCIWFISLPLGIVAVVLALVARGKIARGEAGGAGPAKAGLITGIIGVVLSILIPLILYAGLRTAGSKFQQEAERIQREAERQQRQTATQPAE